MSEIEIPLHIKNMLREHGGYYIGLVDELDAMLKLGKITEYSIYQNAIFIYNHEESNHYVDRCVVDSAVWANEVCRRKLRSTRICSRSY